MILKNDTKQRVIISEIENKLNGIFGSIDKQHGEINLIVGIKVCDGTIQRDWEITSNFKAKKVFN